jgi:hypothetical protein
MIVALFLVAGSAAADVPPEGGWTPAGAPADQPLPRNGPSGMDPAELARRREIVRETLQEGGGGDTLGGEISHWFPWAVGGFVLLMVARVLAGVFEMRGRRSRRRRW